MSDSATLDMLRGLEFFHGIADEHLKRLAEIARPVEFPAQSEMFRELDKAKDVYVIVQGQVSLVFCEPSVGCRHLMQVGDGELVGWSPLVGRSRMSDTAQTLTQTKAIAFDGEQVLALCQEYPRFGCEFMHRAAKVLAQRLSAALLRLLEMCGLQLPDAQLESD